MLRIAVLGSGSWGSALALHLARFHDSVILWGRDAATVAEINQAHCNQAYLPDIIFPPHLKASTDLPAVVKTADMIVLSVPSHATASVVSEIAHELPKNALLVLTAKGFAPSGELLHQHLLKNFRNLPLVLLSGPSFAKEVALGFPTAVTMAAEHLSLAEQASKIFARGQFQVEVSQDMTGVQLGGAIKNVLAIALGIVDGLGFGTNTLSALCVFGLREAMRLASAIGANPETLLGLSGVGDLILTGTDNQSRNRRFGKTLGMSKAGELPHETYLVEGALAAKHIEHLANQHSLVLPICHQVYQILEGKARPTEVLSVFETHL